MKKQTIKNQQSCIDISKYKFIPSSKLLQTKNNKHFQSMAQSSINQQSLLTDKPKSNASTSIKNLQKSNSGTNKENENKLVKKQNKMFRSISNPKLQNSNSRHALLANKNPSFQAYKQQQQHLEKLAQFIQQLQNKDCLKNSQLACLKQQNKSLNQKLEKSYQAINQKNKQILQLSGKIKHLQNQLKQKAHQNTLIIDSLKKVIQSQAVKINQIKYKYNRMIKVRGVNNYHIKTQFDQNGDISDDQNSIKQYQQQATNVQQPPTKCKGFLKFIRNSLNQQNRRQQSNQQQKYKQTQTSIHNTSKVKIPTPDFGARTPQQQKMSSLQSSIVQQNLNLTLSRISQSAEQDFETSRQNIKVQQVQKINNNNNNKYNSIKNSTHQQLLDQIDQYLSKKTYLPHRR